MRENGCGREPQRWRIRTHQGDPDRSPLLSAGVQDPHRTQHGNHRGDPAEHQAKAEGEAKGEAKGESKGEVFSYLIDNLVLNPANSGGGRFLLASVNLRLTDAATKESLVQRDAEARDAILRVLGTKQVEELVNIGNRERFKKDIRALINGMFPGKNVVLGVYFSQFVIQ